MVGLSQNFTIVKNMRSDESRTTLELFRAEKRGPTRTLNDRKKTNSVISQKRTAICHSCEEQCTYIPVKHTVQIHSLDFSLHTPSLKSGFPRKIPRIPIVIRYFPGSKINVNATNKRTRRDLKQIK